MNTTTLRPFETPPSRSFSAALLGLALVSCDAPRAPSQTRAAATPARDVFAFESGGGTRARVTRRLAKDGSETLHGETELALGARARRCIVEDVQIDASGHLAGADVVVASSCDAEPESRVHLDPASDPTPLPWIYMPELLPGHPVTTPVAAWVAHRAAGVSPSLALVQPGRRAPWRVPSDQVEVPTELGTTVVLGSDGADVGASFVDRVGLGDLGATLVRVPRGEEPSI